MYTHVAFTRREAAGRTILRMCSATLKQDDAICCKLYIYIYIEREIHVSSHISIHIYIYIERERCMHIYISTYIYIYIYIQLVCLFVSTLE